MINIHIWHPFMLGSAILMTAYGFVPAIACTVICAFRFNAFLKAGICTAVSGITLYHANHIATALFGPSDGGSYQVDFHNWEQCLNGNIQFIILIAFLIASVILLTVGLFRLGKSRRQ